MDLLFGHDKAVADWVGDKVGKSFSEPYTAFGVIKDGRLIGGAVFTGFTGDAIELSIAGRGVVCRGLWAAVHNYVFRQLRCHRLAIHTSSENKRVRKMAPHFGFVFEGKSRNLFGKHDGFCYSIVRGDLPALRKKWGI